MFRFIITILSLIIVIVSSFYFLIFKDFINYSNGEDPIFPLEEKYKNFLDEAKGKNYINDNQKIFLVREFVVTQDQKVTGVVVLGGKKKNFSNKSLNELKKYTPEKVYITKIGDIELKGYIEINDLTQNTNVFSNIKEEKKK